MSEELRSMPPSHQSIRTDFSKEIFTSTDPVQTAMVYCDWLEENGYAKCAAWWRKFGIPDIEECGP